MTEPLQPHEIQAMLDSGGMISPRTQRLCRDYLTLWEKYDKLAEKYDVLALDVIELARVDGLNDLQNALKDEKPHD